MATNNWMPIEVHTNSYEVTRLPTAVYYHYDVEMQPESLIKRRNHEVVDRLQLENAAIFTPRAVYDGRKNMFCTRDIPGGNYTVAMGRSRSIQVYIKRVSIIRPSDVQKLIRRRSPDDFSDNAMPLNLLQLIVRQAPNMRHKFPADARSFYIQQTARELKFGISVWRGFFQSVRPVLGKLVINVDVSHAAIYTPGPLIDSMMAHLQLNDRRDLLNLDTRKLAQLRMFLKGVLVKMNLSNMRPRPISDLVLEAGMQEFDKDNERWTVARHFESKYNVQVRFPRMVGVRVGRTAIIPAEFCNIVPGQLYRKKIPPVAQKDFLLFATQKPGERLRDIQQAVGGRDQLFDYATSDFMKEAGMAVNTNTMSIPGVVITPPQIVYGNGNMRIGHKAGSWNVVGKTFIQPAELRFWSVAVFDRVRDGQVERFIMSLIGNLRKAGLNVINERPQIRIGNPSNPIPTLEDCARASLNPEFAAQGRALYPQLIVVILGANAADTRRAVKNWGDIKKSVPTQCVRSPKWMNANDQYCNNVALKINSRIGGINSVLADSPPAKFLESCMVVGADVGHPGPGAANRPSVTGLVASVDPKISKMTSFANVQKPRQEIIEDLEGMMIRALTDYQAYATSQGVKNAPPPKHILFYRDGVSEGEFAQVAAREIPLIKNALVRCHIPQHLMPRLLFIVVGKRHHIRFFPKRPEDGDRSGNCPAGLLIDKHITNPNYPDFYLQSHAGLLGTSRPSHYVILENEAGLSPDQVQMLTFYLCHMYASATRSVSIPAPVYYADRICARMEFHCENGDSLSDTASNLTAERQEFDLEYWKETFKQSGLNKRMYFL